MGGSTAGTLLANAVAPGILDRYLARTGFKSQQTDEPRDRRTQPANLWEPADGRGEPDAGAHGDFDDKAKARSAQLWASQHHGLLAAAGGALAARLGPAWALSRNTLTRTLS